MQIEVIRSNRKTLALTVGADGKVTVRAPRYTSEREIREFVSRHEDWIRKHLAQVGAFEQKRQETDTLNEEQLRALANDAVDYFGRRTGEYAKRMGVSYGRITIRNQKSKWGSCTSTGNLNFNCMLMLAPEEVRDYVIVHELSHRRHMNHSKEFWAEVEKVLPDYRTSKKWLKDHGMELMLRNPNR